MTLEQIITSALKETGDSTDAQTTDAFYDKYRDYANDAMLDIARHIRQSRSENVPVANGVILISDLSKGVCKVSSVTVAGTSYGFSFATPGKINIGTVSGTATVVYEYAPTNMQDGIESPDVPEHFHALIPIYMAYRVNLAKDPTYQRRAEGFRDLYEQSKRRIAAQNGGADQYKIINKFD